MTPQPALPTTGGHPGTPGRLLAGLLRRSRGWALLLLLTSLLAAAADTLLPAALGGAVDGLLGHRAAGGPSAPWSGLSGVAGRGGWLAVLAVLAAVAVAGDAASQLATGASTAGSTAWLRRCLIRHLVGCGPQLTRQIPPGDAVSRVIGGAAEAGGATAGAALAATAIIPVAGAVVLLILIDPWLALALAAGFPVLAMMLRRFTIDTSDVVTRYQQAQGAIATRLLEALAGARTIAAAGTAVAEISRVLSPLPRLRVSGEQTWRIQGRAAAQGGLLIPLLEVLVLAAGGIELAAHRITPGELLAASQYAVVGAGAGAAISHLGRLARARAGVARAADVLAVPAPAAGTRQLPPGPGRLEFRGVSVWSGDGKVILNRIDLVIPGGTALAVVGPSGAGKSVLAALAGRLADPGQGEILLDGIPLADLAPADLHRAVRYAFARPALLGDTIAGTIAFGDPPVTRQQAVTAARAARADSFIRRLPRGYDTPLAQAPLSGGETQRLGLARAFARTQDARVLILDDATSSLDTVTEMHITQALTTECSRLTRLITAHRASTAARAGLVAWLAEGRLLACAPHQELWADPGYRAVFGACGGAAVGAPR